MVWGPPSQHGPPAGGQSGYGGYPAPGGPPGTGGPPASGYPGTPGGYSAPPPGQQGYPAAAPPPGPSPAEAAPGTLGGDAFTAAERETRALVTAPWWPASQPMQRQQVLSPYLLTLPDSTWWIFGAGGRWYRRHPADGRWYPCPPPLATMTRRSARPAQPGQAPPVPPQVFPRGPDLADDLDRPLAVAGRPVPDNITFQLRQILDQAGSATAADYPLTWSFFARGTPSTVAVTWAATLWCASVPAFDEDTPLVELWGPYLAGPLEDHGRMRWLVPPKLGTIAGVYAERLRAGRADAAGQLARFMVMTARALREDPRFRTRADALLAMVEPILSQPGLDQQAVAYGDSAVERQWSGRCPAALATTLSWDTAPGECFQQAWYDLASALEPLCGNPDSPSFVEPRSAATALLAADMAGYRPDLAGEVGGWLDPETRELLGAVLGESGHGLRKLWPSRGQLPATLRPVSRETVLALLGAAAAMDFCWCRVTGGIPIPPDGFTVPDACVVELERAESGGSASVPSPARPSLPGVSVPPPLTPPPPNRPAPTPPPLTPPPLNRPAPASPSPSAAPGPAGPSWDQRDPQHGGSWGPGNRPEDTGDSDPLEDEGEGTWTRMWGS